MKKQIVTKQAIDMPGITTIRLPYTNWPSGGLETSNYKGSWKTVLENYTLHQTMHQRRGECPRHL